jgi:hypothetical protein
MEHGEGCGLRYGFDMVKTLQADRLGAASVSFAPQPLEEHRPADRQGA